MALRGEVPSGRRLKRSGSSPPSPEFERPPMEFMAMAMVSWATLLIEPKDIAPVVRRLKISEAGLTPSNRKGGWGFESGRPPQTGGRWVSRLARRGQFFYLL